MKAELDRKNMQAAEAEAEQMKLQAEVQHCKAEFLDIQRSERATKVDMEQTKKQVQLDVATNEVIFHKFAQSGDNTGSFSFLGGAV